MKLAEAKQLAEDLMHGEGRLASHFTQYVIAGSIRRQKEEVNDIDIVGIQKLDYIFGELDLGDVIQLLDPEGRKQAQEKGKSRASRFLNGEDIKRFNYKGIMIDIYLATPENFEVLRLIRTGSADHNIRLTTLARGKGMKLFANGEGLWNVQNNPNDWKNPTKTTQVSQKEDEILQILLGHVPPPEKR